MLENYKHIIFSDGSALGNPGRGGFGTVVISSKKTVTELGEREVPTTNNKMEITGLLYGLRRLQGESGDVLCCTDSKYAINAVTKWIHGWKKNNWMTTAKKPVEHRELFEEIDELINNYKEHGKIDFRYVPGHVGVLGNERCDAIATAFARGEQPLLFNGLLKDYAIDILNISEDASATEKKNKQKSSKSNGPAYSYLSLINGELQKHKTWKECEARVKGQKATKYKKAMSEEDEKKILHSWGIPT